MDASVNRIPAAKDQKALLLAVRIKGNKPGPIEYSLNELELLVKTAGAVPVETRIVTREKIDASYIVGKGFLEELSHVIEDNDIKLLVFDINNIKPAHVRNLEEALKCRVVGRTEVILDIFARRARSSEAKIQVELAQLRYILPRLKGLGGVLSRLAGGIGTRGPGEKMLETDRRHIQRRINTLSKKLQKVRKHRQRTRAGRSGEVLGAVVGYTNAGKSTLINRFARDDLFVENRLFATLDSYTRSVYLDEAHSVLLTDTVGFIRNLPANLIESFKSTLEEIQNADFLLHVVDITAEDIGANIDTVNSELAALECAHKPVVLFFNKSDLSGDSARAGALGLKYPGSITGSVKNGRGIDELKKALSDLCEGLSKNRGD